MIDVAKLIERLNDWPNMGDCSDIGLTIDAATALRLLVAEAKAQREFQSVCATTSTAWSGIVATGCKGEKMRVFNDAMDATDAALSLEGIKP